MRVAVTTKEESTFAEPFRTAFFSSAFSLHPSSKSNPFPPPSSAHASRDTQRDTLADVPEEKGSGREKRKRGEEECQPQAPGRACPPNTSGEKDAARGALLALTSHAHALKENGRRRPWCQAPQRRGVRVPHERPWVVLAGDDDTGSARGMRHEHQQRQRQHLRLNYYELPNYSSSTSSLQEHAEAD